MTNTTYLSPLEAFSSALIVLPHGLKPLEVYPRARYDFDPPMLPCDNSMCNSKRAIQDEALPAHTPQLLGHKFLLIFRCPFHKERTQEPHRRQLQIQAIRIIKPTSALLIGLVGH